MPVRIKEIFDNAHDDVWEGYLIRDGKEIVLCTGSLDRMRIQADKRGFVGIML